MKALLSKLETLVDEATALVREERARRNMGARGVDLYGPKGTEIRWDMNPLDRTGCAPPPFIGSKIWVGETGPQ